LPGKGILAFRDFAANEALGLDVKLSNGNVAKRILPIRIHEIDKADLKMIEHAIGGNMRALILSINLQV
jgi:hypothetical protein